jgi:hypothetical protein
MGFNILNAFRGRGEVSAPPGEEYDDHGTFTTFSWCVHRLRALIAKMYQEVKADDFQSLLRQVRLMKHHVGMPKKGEASLLRLLEKEQAITATWKPCKHRTTIEAFETELQHELGGVVVAINGLEPLLRKWVARHKSGQKLAQKDVAPLADHLVALQAFVEKMEARATALEKEVDVFIEELALVDAVRAQGLQKRANARRAA